MIPLQELHLSNRGRNSPHAESPSYNQDDEEPDTTSLVAALNHEVGSRDTPGSVMDEVPTLPAADSQDPEPAPGSHDPPNLETSASQPGIKLRFNRFLEKIGLTSTILGFIVAIIVGAASWYGTNTANYYAEKSYKLGLYQACRSYKVKFSNCVLSVCGNQTDNSAGPSKQYSLPDCSQYRDRSTFSSRHSLRN